MYFLLQEDITTLHIVCLIIMIIFENTLFFKVLTDSTVWIVAASVAMFIEYTTVKVLKYLVYSHEHLN